MKKLVIIGGGFAGAKIAKKLQNQFNTTLIDTKNYFEFTPSILNTIIHPNHIKKIQVLHNKYLKKTKIIIGEVTNINSNSVFISKKRIEFDYLVIASGSKYSYPFKEQNIVNVTRAKNLIEQNKNLISSKNIIILGGGVVGVELASEIITNYPNKNVTIIQKSDKILQRNNKKSINYAQNFLQKKGIKIIYNQSIKKIKRDYIITDKNIKVKSDLIFICTGIKSNSEFMEKNFKDFLNEKKQIKVNDFLQISNNKTFENIFAVGDITDIAEEKLAQNAEKQAEIVIKNLLRIIKNWELKKYISIKRIMVISLGSKNGILEYKNFTLTGIIPGILKKLIEIKTMIRFR